jgi:hypothetical protein
MSAVLKPPDTVQAVDAAALAKTKAAAEVLRLQNRVHVIELRAQQTRAERARHQQAVTTALLDGGALPKAREPDVIEPDSALKVVHEALKKAESALADAASQHRIAQVRHVERLRDEATAGYRKAFQHYVAALRTLAALDRVLARTGGTNVLSPLFRSRLGIPALRGDDEASPGLALDGGNFFGKPELEELERATRAAIERDAGALPF